MVALRSLLAFLLVLVGPAFIGPVSFMGPALADDATHVVDPSIGKVEVTLDLPKDKPYVGEMILLRMRAFVRADVALDEIRQPPLINFNWQQLGRDKPIQAMVNGFSVAGVERDLAIFPQQAGRLIIDPFVRRVTIVTSDNERVVTEFASKPIYVDVQTYGAINPADGWWLPAKSLTVTDSWAPEADEIPNGMLARRTIVVEAVGVTGERLPPPPDMRAPGIIAFKGPVERETIITEDGPVGRGTYRWDLRTVSSSPAKLPAIQIPWYDTSERRMREASVPARWVAYLGTFVHASHEQARSLWQRVLSPGPIIAGVAGFAWTAALLAFLLIRHRSTKGHDKVSGRILSTLRKSAIKGDEPGFRAAMAQLARADPRRWSKVVTSDSVAPGFATLDAARFARNPEAPPSLRPLATEIRRLWRAEQVAFSSYAANHLPPLDGDGKDRSQAGGLVARLPFSSARETVAPRSRVG